MRCSTYVLKTDIIAEPLINNWYAWIYLISPLTYSRYLQHHIKLLESYLQAPHIHKQASTEVRLRGGTFLDLGNTAHINDVRALLEYTKNHCSNLTDLSNQIGIVHDRLKPYSIEPMGFNELYNDLPDELRGLVELVYDLQNNPSIRFVEALFYRSPYYKPELQSVLLYQQNPDERAFVLSTPRIAFEKSLKIPLPFESTFYDSFFKARQCPISLPEIKAIYLRYLSTTTITFNEFMFFFTEANNHKPNVTTVKNAVVSIQYYGHACVLIQTTECTILIDPLISYENPSSDIPRLSLSDLPEKIDYVLLTHSHQDHAVLETLIQIRYKINTIVVPQNNNGALQDPSLKLALQFSGFKNIHEVSELDTIQVNNGTIEAIPFFGEHADLDIRTKTAYLVTLNNESILFLADSKNLDPWIYKRLAKQFPPIDKIFIGLECEGAPLSWLYGPIMLEKLSRKTNSSRRLNGSNSQEGYYIIKDLGCKDVYIYAMGYEPWLTFISNLDKDTSTLQITEAEKLIQLCEKNGIRAELLYGSKTFKC